MLHKRKRTKFRDIVFSERREWGEVKVLRCPVEALKATMSSESRYTDNNMLSIGYCAKSLKVVNDIIAYCPLLSLTQ